MSPETFLRVLGPKPYRVAYVQPSRRPADGRYGENPNRLYKHTQFQVILKAPPENDPRYGNPQEYPKETLDQDPLDKAKASQKGMPGPMGGGSKTPGRSPGGF